MNNELKQSLGVAGVGAAAAAAGFGASKAYGNDSGTSVMYSAGAGLTASVLAHVIQKKVNERQPIAGKTNSLLASLVAGTGVSVASLTGLNALLNNKAFMSRAQKANKTVFDSPVGKSLTGLNKALSDTVQAIPYLNKGKNLSKAVGRNKPAIASLLAGAATVPFVYNALRGSGSD